MPAKPSKAPLKPYVVRVPMDRVQMDLIGPLPQTRFGHKYVLTVTCCFTKWTESYSLKIISAKAVASTFVKECMCRYGLVKEIHTDQGRQFESELFQEMCVLLGIEKTRTTAMLSTYIKSNHWDWDEILPFRLMAYNSSRHETTNQTPSLLFLGRDLLYPPPPVESKSPNDEYVLDLQNKLKSVHEMARNSLLEASHTKTRRVSKHCYKIGDAVWLRSYMKAKGLSKKLQMRWEGLIKVGKTSDLTYKVQRKKKSDFKVVHFNRLKPFSGNLSNSFTCGTS